MKTIERLDVTISTDGACSGNPGPGGYAAILRFGSHEKVVRGFEKQTTNNRMELRAVIEATRALKKPCNIVVRTDSQYVCTGLANIKDWYKNNWHTKSGARCANYDLWQELTEVKAAGKHKFQFVHVKGHDTDRDNNRCDWIAKEQIQLHAKEA